jgi:hypothetical protein
MRARAAVSGPSTLYRRLPQNNALVTYRAGRIAADRSIAPLLVALGYLEIVAHVVEQGRHLAEQSEKAKPADGNTGYEGHRF